MIDKVKMTQKEFEEIYEIIEEEKNEVHKIDGSNLSYEQTIEAVKKVENYKDVEEIPVEVTYYDTKEEMDNAN